MTPESSESESEPVELDIETIQQWVVSMNLQYFVLDGLDIPTNQDINATLFHTAQKAFFINLKFQTLSFPFIRSCNSEAYDLTM